MADAIVIKGVTKTFREKVAVRDLDLVVPQGSICGFIGPNGAGKTTTLRMIMSIIFPDSGDLSLLGKRSPVESKDRIGYLPEERGLYRKMKVGAFLAYMARIKGDRGPDLIPRLKQMLVRVGLADVYNKKCEELSKGMQQKVQFLSATIHDPELLILDEPFSGLDPVSTRLLRELIDEQHASGKTIIFSTHVMHQAEHLCDHIFMIHEGRKVLDATMDEIRSRFDPRTILVELADPAESAAPIERLPGVHGVQRNEGTYEVLLESGADPRRTIQAIATLVAVNRIELRRPTLEDVFVEIVQGTGTRDEANLRASLRGDRPPVLAQGPA